MVKNNTARIKVKRKADKSVKKVQHKGQANHAEENRIKSRYIGTCREMGQRIWLLGFRVVTCKRVGYETTSVIKSLNHGKIK